MKTGTDPYENLASAIVIQAAKDYRKALADLKRNPDSHAAERMRKETERFFLSDWFTVLTELDGEFLMRKIRDEDKA